MDNETAINAFAAGHSINDAVIAVTRGTLTRLSRDELQGVIAHEFSHVLNGDMRLNLRLIGVLHGLLIVAIAGRLLLEVGGPQPGRKQQRRSGNALAILFFAGIALWILGYIGVFFGRLIKAAVSRQREFLADASAVQFTRNPDGIGGALRKIGGLTETTGLGTRIDHPQAEALSHLFLGAARPSFVRGLFATHPSLEERVQRIYGRKQAFLPAPENALALAMSGQDAGTAARASAKHTGLNALSPVAGLVAAAAGGAAAQGEIAAAVGTVAPPAHRDFALDESQRATVDTLRRAANDAIHAQLIAFALLVEKDSELRAQQCELIAEAYGTEASQLADRYHGLIHQLPPGARQPLLDLAMPALRKLPAPARQRVLKLAHLLIVADGRVSVREFLLFTILKRRLGPDASKAVPVRYRSVSELRAGCGTGSVVDRRRQVAEAARARVQRRRVAVARIECRVRRRRSDQAGRRIGCARSVESTGTARQTAADQGRHRGSVRRQRDQLARCQHAAHDLCCTRRAVAAADCDGMPHESAMQR